MNRMLAWIALGGLGIGIACLSLAYVSGGRGASGLVSALIGPTCDMHAGSAAAERHLPWPGGDSVDIAVPATVRYRPGSGSDVIVRGPGDLIERLAIRGGTVALDCFLIGRSSGIEIVLPGRAFRRIGLNGSGHLVMENVDQPDLAVHIAGSGSVRAQGRVDRVELNIAGSGQVVLADLLVQRLVVKIAGSGKVESPADEFADIDISGSGEVRLLSRPKALRSVIAGSGRVSQLPEKTERN